MNALKRQLAQMPRRASLRSILVVPFVLQIFAAVGMTGWLSLRNGQQAVNEVTAQLRQEVSLRIYQQLKVYLAAPRAIAQIDIDAIQLGQLDIEDTGSLTRQFWRQRHLFDSITVSAIYFGTEAGEFIGLGFQDDQTWQIGRAGQSTGNRFYSYAVDGRGNPATLLEQGQAYDPRIRPWYEDAVKVGAATWSPIYVDFKDPRLKVTLAQPLYAEDGRLRGVVGVDFVLSHIREFLQQVKIGRSGQTFIVERSGFLVATSTQQQPFKISQGEVKRIMAEDVEQPLIRETAQYLSERFEDLYRIQNVQQLEFKLYGERQFLQVVPFSDGRNLDWLIVVVVPEADFMERIHRHTYTTIQLCLLALAIAIAIGLLTSRWIAQPILQLNEASRAIASGDFDRIVRIRRVDELATLAYSFNQMSIQLKASHEQLADYSRSLEQKVDERTQALQQEIVERTAAEVALRLSQEKFYTAFRSSPDPITISTLAEGRYIEVNDSFLKLSGYTLKETIGHISLDLGIWVRPQDRDRVLQTLQSRGPIRNQEYEFRNRWGEIRTMLLSAEIVDLDGQPCILAIHNDITERKQATLALQAEQEKSERLLHNILPQTIANQLKEGQTTVAEQFEAVTILFADIVDFTALATQLPPTELVDLLNQIFSTFDRIAERHGVEKIKTVGDAYMAVAGLSMTARDRTSAIAEMALDMQTVIPRFQRTNGDSFQLRIGINTGTVVAGVIGIRKFAYDLWGDTVNVASRMETQGQAGKIQVTAPTYECLKEHYHLEERGTISIKGKGNMKTYWLLGRKR